MRKLISIILIFTILSGITQLKEAIKFPFLVQHYFEHKVTHPEISFINFLNNHYIRHKKAESDKDKKSDSQLPFKSLQNNHIQFFPFIPENKTIQFADEGRSDNFSLFTTPGIFSRSIEIWLPPKVG